MKKIFYENGVEADACDYDFFSDKMYESDSSIFVILPDDDVGYLKCFATWADYEIWCNQE